MLGARFRRCVIPVCDRLKWPWLPPLRPPSAAGSPGLYACPAPHTSCHEPHGLDTLLHLLNWAASRQQHTWISTAWLFEACSIRRCCAASCACAWDSFSCVLVCSLLAVSRSASTLRRSSLAASALACMPMTTYVGMPKSDALTAQVRKRMSHTERSPFLWPAVPLHLRRRLSRLPVPAPVLQARPGVISAVLQLLPEPAATGEVSKAQHAHAFLSIHLDTRTRIGQVKYCCQCTATCALLASSCAFRDCTSCFSFCSASRLALPACSAAERCASSL